ncbi:MAG: PD-(D/E)XK nuclease family protein [Bacilli bacterium]|jgi:hypothetical protein
MVNDETYPQRWDAALESMRSAWREILADADVAQGRATEQSLEAWESALERMSAEQEALVRAGDWVSGPADLLSVIGRSRRETYHCSIIAWLMDPTGRHLLGTRFLHELLASCKRPIEVDETVLRSATIACEVSRPNSRADLVVRAPGLTVVFEAKIDHDERAHQCDDLFKDFRNEKGICFVFLTHDGRDPTSATGDAKEAFRTLGFGPLRKVLLEALVEARRERQSAAFSTVETYLETLEVVFP